MENWKSLVVVGAAALVCLTGCQAPQGETVSERRAYVEDMRDQVLAELYKVEPQAKSEIKDAAGYGVFTNVSSKILLVATGNGYGVVRDNDSGDDKYMRMIEVGGGLGLGAKKYRAVYVFSDATSMRRFVTEGWEFAGDADAAAKVDEEGGEVGVAGTSGQLAGLKVYQLTDAGLALSATVTGVKFYTDDELN